MLGHVLAVAKELSAVRMVAVTAPGAEAVAKLAKEWDAVCGANDLVQLESFVKTFGPYFASGREAQFLLSERLMLTNNDDDKRKAQSYLLNLVGEADEFSRLLPG